MDDEFVKIGTFEYSTEAEILRGKLEFEGVETYLRDNLTVDSNPLFSNAVGGVKLFVRKVDELKALSILSDVSKYSVDNQNELIICPKCGSESAQLYTTIKDFKSMMYFIFAMLVVILPFNAKTIYRCENCKHEFNQ